MADERGSVVVRERPILGWKFLFFNKTDSLYQLKNFLSVLKWRTTVYETETCSADVRRHKSNGTIEPDHRLGITSLPERKAFLVKTIIITFSEEMEDSHRQTDVDRACMETSLKEESFDQEKR